MFWRHNVFRVQVAISILMLAVLLLPMVLVVMPSPVSAEELALYRDLQTSRCAAQGMPGNDDHDTCDHCVLCAANTFATPVRTADPFVVLRPLLQIGKSYPTKDFLLRVDLAFQMVPDPGRGPPA